MQFDDDYECEHAYDFDHKYDCDYDCLTCSMIKIYLSLSHLCVELSGNVLDGGKLGFS